MVSQVEKVATKIFNYYLEEADGDLLLAKDLFESWVEETADLVAPESRDSLLALVMSVYFLFKDASGSA